MPLLGVNIDHVATIRQARGTRYPEPLQAAWEAELGGADGITVHLREDRRHIQLEDVQLLKEKINTRLNLEMAPTNEMVAIAKTIQPAFCCLVPERREELTTEGGLNVSKYEKEIKQVCEKLRNAGIFVSLFIDPEIAQIEASKRCGAEYIEIHTGEYANAVSSQLQKDFLDKIRVSAAFAVEQGLIVNAGHGLHYHNVHNIVALPEIHELNIGHAIVARALMTGMQNAVREMKELVNNQEKSQ